MHAARIEAAERTGVVVDLRDAEVARLELLDEALNPLFAEIPSEVDLFDRGISRGDTPRLWIDAVAHVAMGRDKRMYRFLHDTRLGRRVMAESHDPRPCEAVTDCVARRLIERERALDEDPDFMTRVARPQAVRAPPPAARMGRFRARLLGRGDRAPARRLAGGQPRLRCSPNCIVRNPGKRVTDFARQCRLRRTGDVRIRIRPAARPR